MKGLEEVAAATVGISIIPFLAAWHAEGKAGQRYRETVRAIFHLPIATAYLLAGLVVSATLPVLMRLSDSDKLRRYRMRRNYQGLRRVVNPSALEA